VHRLWVIGKWRNDYQVFFSINSDCFYALYVCSLFILTCLTFFSPAFLVPHFSVLHFHVLFFCVSLSSPAFSTRCNFLCRIFMSCIFSRPQITNKRRAAWFFSDSRCMMNKKLFSFVVSGAVLSRFNRISRQTVWYTVVLVHVQQLWAVHSNV